MSFEKLIQDIVAKTAGGAQIVVYAPVTVYVSTPAMAPDPLGQVLDVSKNPKSVPAKGDAWKAAENQAQAARDEQERKAALAEALTEARKRTAEGKGKQPESPEADVATPMAEANFRGTVGEQTLVDKALNQELKGAVGHRLWELLNTSRELRAFCADLGVDFPLLGKNGMFRRADLKSLARRDGITRVKGFGTRSQALQLLKSL
ncbi:MAG TPA: hypothetical protein VFH06_01795 [Candidatus Saccharimonadales bacterium]|nr:hypothetical protein [Candidatus Saccharimonadales bacterium]